MIQCIKRAVAQRKREKQCDGHVYYRQLIDVGRSYFWVCLKCGKWTSAGRRL